MSCSALSLSTAARDAADGEVIEGRDGIGLRPQADAAGLEPGVTVVEVQRAVEPRLYVIANRHDPDRMPLPERRGLHAGGRELTAAPVVVVEPEIVLERVRPHEVVLAVGEAQHDTAGGVFPSGDRLELQRHVDIGIRARRRDDHIEFVPRCSLDEHLLAARRAGHLFHSVPLISVTTATGWPSFRVGMTLTAR